MGTPHTQPDGDNQAHKTLFRAMDIMRARVINKCRNRLTWGILQRTTPAGRGQGKNIIIRTAMLRSRSAAESRKLYQTLIIRFLFRHLTEQFDLQIGIYLAHTVRTWDRLPLSFGQNSGAVPSGSAEGCTMSERGASKEYRGDQGGSRAVLRGEEEEASLAPRQAFYILNLISLN